MSTDTYSRSQSLMKHVFRELVQATFESPKISKATVVRQLTGIEKVGTGLGGRRTKRNPSASQVLVPEASNKKSFTSSALFLVFGTRLNGKDYPYHEELTSSLSANQAAFTGRSEISINLLTCDAFCEPTTIVLQIFFALRHKALVQLPQV